MLQHSLSRMEPTRAADARFVLALIVFLLAVYIMRRKNKSRSAPHTTNPDHSPSMIEGSAPLMSQQLQTLHQL